MPNLDPMQMGLMLQLLQAQQHAAQNMGYPQPSAGLNNPDPQAGMSNLTPGPSRPWWAPQPGFNPNAQIPFPPSSPALPPGAQAAVGAGAGQQMPPRSTFGLPPGAGQVMGAAATMPQQIPGVPPGGFQPPQGLRSIPRELGNAGFQAAIEELRRRYNQMPPMPQIRDLLGRPIWT